MPDTFSLLHLKPWSTTHSRPCGCSLERRADGGVAYMACRQHHRAFVAVVKAMESARERGRGGAD